jgi:glycosyltransferase involved in cell wall biosynthesis
MAMGVPVVTSSVAADGVDAVSGAHLMVADTPMELVRTIMGIVDNPAERGRLAEAGRQRMLNRHAWTHSMVRLDAIIDRCVRNFSDYRMGVVA